MKNKMSCRARHYKWQKHCVSEVVTDLLGKGPVFKHYFIRDGPILPHVCQSHEGQVPMKTARIPLWFSWNIFFYHAVAMTNTNTTAIHKALRQIYLGLGQRQRNSSKNVRFSGSGREAFVALKGGSTDVGNWLYLIRSYNTCHTDRLWITVTLPVLSNRSSRNCNRNCYLGHKQKLKYT